MVVESGGQFSVRHPEPGTYAAQVCDLLRSPPLTDNMQCRMWVISIWGAEDQDAQAELIVQRIGKTVKALSDLARAYLQAYKDLTS